jgi:DNA-dependent protein kinase catalytic subunit
MHQEADLTVLGQTNDRENRKVCLQLFKKFIAEVLGRVKQYKDELLAACIELALSVPRQFVDVSLLLPALQTAFKIGLSYLPLAEVGLGALEHWLEALPRGFVDRALPVVLPSLAEYLRKDWVETRERTVLSELRYESAALRKKNRSEVIEMLKRREKQGKEPALAIQLRIVRLLGRLGGKNVNLLGTVNLMAQGTESGMWDC